MYSSGGIAQILQVRQGAVDVALREEVLGMGEVVERKGKVPHLVHVRMSSHSVRPLV